MSLSAEERLRVEDDDGRRAPQLRGAAPRLGGAAAAGPARTRRAAGLAPAPPPPGRVAAQDPAAPLFPRHEGVAPRPRLFRRFRSAQQAIQADERKRTSGMVVLVSF